MRTLFLCCLLLFVCFAASQAPDCAQHPDCSTCVTNDPACGWCSATQQCLPGNKTGPTAGHCIHAWEYGECLECEKNTDCRSCMHYGSECFWCREKRTCLQIGYIGCAPADTCPCEDYDSCRSCNTANCHWCSNSEVCISTTNTTHPCERDANCFCEGNPNCGSCMTDPQCGWCDDTRSCVMKAGHHCNTTRSCEFSCSRAGASCEVCSAVDGCGWCASSKKCMDINTNLHICDVTQHCATLPVTCPRKFDGGSFVGGISLAAGLCLISAVVYVFYKKKQNTQYQQL